MRRKFELDILQFVNSSNSIPMTVQVRLELERLGMKFTDSGKCSSIINENPEPLGIVTYWEQPDKQCTRFYTQEI